MSRLLDPETIRERLNLPPEGPVPRYISARNLRAALDVSRSKLKSMAALGIFGEPIRLSDHKTAESHFAVDAVLAWLRKREIHSRSRSNVARTLAQKMYGK